MTEPNKEGVTAINRMSEDRKLIIAILEKVCLHQRATGKVLKSLTLKWDKNGHVLDGYTATYEFVDK